MNTQEIAAITGNEQTFRDHMVRSSAVMETDIRYIKKSIKDLSKENDDQNEKIGKLEAFNKKVIGIVIGITAVGKGIPAILGKLLS